MINKKTKNLLIILLAGLFLSLGLAVYSQICGQKDQEDIEFQIYEKGIYVVSIDSVYFAKNSDIYVSESLETVYDVAKKNNVKIAINTGFFDPNNAKTISYVLKNNVIVENPENNERLIQSEELKPYLDKIFNRSEFRVFNHPHFYIAKHFDPLEEKCIFKYSIQAGPELVPDFDLEEEFFILKKDGKVVRESVSALQKVARSAIGIKKDRILLVAVSNEKPMTLEELSGFMKNLDVEQAMAFDGGSSTSLYVDKNLIGMETDKPTFVLTSAKDNAARRVKSILIVK